jgi:hypothetical protein
MFQIMKTTPVISVNLLWCSVRLGCSARFFFRSCRKATEAVKVCLKSEDAFVITRVANLMEVKVSYVQQDLRYEISS